MTILNVNEIFYSLQGESVRAGFPTIFIRLSGCNLRCDYCDTSFAWDEGTPMNIDEIAQSIAVFKCRQVEITGGEPLAQEGVSELAVRLLALGYRVMVETNGAFNIGHLPDEAIKIVDIKCPGSGEAGTFLEDNLARLKREDEIKFVISSRSDFDWALNEINTKNLTALCTVNVSPVAGKVKEVDVASWILQSGKHLRLNLQIHKIIWGDKRGV